MAARLAIILAQIPVFFFMLYDRKRKPEASKGRRILFLAILEFICVILALVIAGLITGKW